MKIDKKKIVFGSVIGIVLLFIVGYSLLIFGQKESSTTLDDPIVPELEEEPKEYTSRMEALQDLKKERERQIPDIYSEELLDTSAHENSQLEQQERAEVVDSQLYPRILKTKSPEGIEIQKAPDSVKTKVLKNPEISIAEMARFHERFFKSYGIPTQETASDPTAVIAQVNGNQKVKNYDRLELILLEDLVIDSIRFKKHSRIYGNVSLQPNRVQIKIERINALPVDLDAYDLQDSGKGIYVKNSLREEAGKEVLEDLVQDVNLTGVPQVKGLKSIFRKNNRNKKVTILDQYKLILKSSP